MPTSYLTHFSISGETLALINSALLPASAFTNRNLESIFNPETPTASVGGVGSLQCDAAGRPAPSDRDSVTASPVSESELARAVVYRGNLTVALASYQAK